MSEDKDLNNFLRLSALDFILPIVKLAIWWFWYKNECVQRVKQVFQNFFSSRTEIGPAVVNEILIDPEIWNKLIFVLPLASVITYLIFLSWIYRLIKPNKKQNIVLWTIFRSVRILAFVILLVDIFAIKTHIPFEANYFFQLVPHWPQASELIEYAFPIIEIGLLLLMLGLSFTLLLGDIFFSPKDVKFDISRILMVLDGIAYFLFFTLSYVRQWKDLTIISLTGACAAIFEMMMMDMYVWNEEVHNKLLAVFLIRFATIMLFVIIGISAVGYLVSHTIFWLGI